MTYELIDSGDGTKLERFGSFTLIRPCPQAIWRKQRPEVWKEADAEFSRENKAGWAQHRALPSEWTCEVGGVQFKIAPTDFGHLGVFPEHAAVWQGLKPLVKGGNPQVLNLFAYSGGATLALAREGARVCHLDASKGMVDWARQNAQLNQLEKAPVRWIVDDAMKFLRREIKRGVHYEGILLDPPTFGRGSQGEVFKIERDLMPLLQLCKSLAQQIRFIAVSCHTPSVTPLALKHLLSQIFESKNIETGEMVLHSEGALPIPSGSFAKIYAPNH